jgi:hypothetical protein
LTFDTQIFTLTPSDTSELWNAAVTAIATVSGTDRKAVTCRHEETSPGYWRYVTDAQGLAASLDLQYAAGGKWARYDEGDGAELPACWAEINIATSGVGDRQARHAEFVRLLADYLTAEDIDWCWMWSGDSFTDLHTGVNALTDSLPR